jgi:hypothetical protein
MDAQCETLTLAMVGSALRGEETHLAELLKRV